MDQETRRHVYWCGDAETKLACHNKADKSSESQQGGPFIVTSQHSVANDMSISCWFQESFLLKKKTFSFYVRKCRRILLEVSQEWSQSFVGY